jgi:hypothetical protein
MTLPDITYLRTLLIYNPADGSFTWLPREMDNRWSQQFAGKAAGHPDSHGYLQIKIDGTPILAHRIAWAIVTNEWPPEMIDHINGDPLDNSWRNLRCASRSQNMANSKPRADNSTGYRGVVRSRTPGKFYAQIGFNKQTKHLGTFDSAIAAHEAYVNAAREMFGEYVRQESRNGI